MRKTYIIFLLVVILSGAGIFLYSTLKSRDAFSENLIISLSGNLEKELASYFDPLRTEFDNITGNYSGFSGHQMNIDTLSSQIIPVISGIPAIGAVMIYNNTGYVYAIYRDKNTLVSSLEKPEDDGGALVWSRRMNDNSVSSSWTEVLTGQQDRIEVLQDILDEMVSDNESVIWTGIYHSRQLKEPVITAAVDWTSSLDSSTFVCTFTMPVRLMIRHLNTFNKYRNRRIFISMASGQLIDIPASVSDSIPTFDEQYKEGLVNTISDSILLSFIDSWKHLGGDTDMTFHQHLDGDDWWIHIRDFSNFEKIAAVGLAMPEGSLKMGLVRSYSRISLVILFLMISILIYLTAGFKRKKTAKTPGSSTDQTGSTSDTNSASDTNLTSDTNFGNSNASIPESGSSDTASDSQSLILTPESISDWTQLINQGENQSLDFKSALRMDMNQGKVNPGLENVIIKSVAAFSNGDGGILLIRVRDDGGILGIESDLSTLKRQDSDYFEIHLRNLLKQQFGVTFITRNLSVQFPKLEDKEICAISVSKGADPVYVTTMDKNGNKQERFYVRSGNSSQEIQSLKEINEYIDKRF